VQADAELPQGLDHLAYLGGGLAGLDLSNKGMGKPTDLVLVEVLPLSSRAHEPAELLGIADWNQVLHELASRQK
jgi:hypothetical protein